MKFIEQLQKNTQDYLASHEEKKAKIEKQIEDMSKRLFAACEKASVAGFNYVYDASTDDILIKKLKKEGFKTSIEKVDGVNYLKVEW